MRSLSRPLRVFALGALALFALALAEPPVRADETADETIRSAYREANSNRFEQGIGILEAYLKAHPEDEKRGKLRVALGDLYERSGRKDDAKAIFRKAIDEDEEGSADAGWRLMNLLGCGFYMWSDRTWGPGDTPRIGFNVWASQGLEHPDTIPCELYKVDGAKLEAAWREHPCGLEQMLGRPPKGSLEKVSSWDEAWPKSGGGEPIALKDVKGTGIFLLIAKPLGVSFRMPIVVAAHALVVKRAGGKGLVFAADRASGAPIADLALDTIEGTTVKALGKTDASGCWEGKLEGNGEVAAWKDGTLAASHSWWWGTTSVGSLVTHFSTDRPIYRPGHTVHWKAIVRVVTASGDYALPEKGKKWNASARDPNGAELWKGVVEANDYGTVGGDLELKEGCPLGQYAIDVGTGTFGGFRVEEYRKPEFQVKVDAPSSVVQGETLEAKVTATYYFGAPVTKAEVAWQVQRRPHWRPWWTLFPCNDVWFFEDDDDARGRGWYGRGELMSQGHAEIGKDGTFTIEVPVERKDDPRMALQDESLTVVARVVDASRREEQGWAEILAPRASFSLYAQPQRWVYRPGDEVALDVRALDAESRPRAGVALIGTATIREWENGKGYKEGKKVATVEGTTDANGHALLKLSADARGSIEVAITAQDEKGREVRAEAYVWQADALWASPTRTNMECVADRRTYAVGDTATVLCTMPAEKGSALVTRERDGILAHSVEPWEKGVLLLTTKLEDRDMPNVFVTVTAVAGALHQGTAELVVVPEKRLLDVTVSFDKATYQPREKAIVKVTAIDRVTRAPVQAEVAVGVVDASLYALAADPAIDLRKFFYRRRMRTVQTSSSFEWWVQGRAGANLAARDMERNEGGVGQAFAAPGAPPAPMAARAKKAGEAEGPLVEAAVRKDFPDTWVWRGTLETDAKGEAVLELTVPDSLTTWRATARAVTRETQVGTATAEAKVFLPVLVRVEPPRFLVQGDTGGLSALVHNYLGQGKKTKVTWTATGPVTLGKPTVTGGELMELGDGTAWIAIPSQGEARLDWFAAHADKPGKVELEVKAQTDEASDAMRAPAFPVIAHGSPRFVSWAGALEDAGGSDASSPSSASSQTIELAIPEGSIPEAIELDLSITPSVAATMLDSLESLAGYPYGCVEQTMSRFLPDVVAIDTLRKLSVDEPALRAELPKMIENGLARLRGYQHTDGGWGWWEHDETHPYMTAYVVYGLSLARAADVKVDDTMYKRGVVALEQLLSGKARAAHGDVEDPNARAYMLFALSQAKKAPAKALAKAFEDRSHLDAYGKAVLARALFRSGSTDDASTLAKELVASAKTTGSACQWEVDAGIHGWTSLDTETTAQALHALEEIGEGKELWTKAVRWLVAHRRGRWWYSTRDTAMVVYALAEHMSMTNELDADEDISIVVGDKELVKQHVGRSNVLATRVGLKLGMSDLGGARTVTFKRSGKGLAYYAAHLRTTSFVEDMKPSPGAIGCSRSIVVFHRDKDGTETHEELGKEPVHVGDELHVTLRVQASEVREYLLVEDPIPAGCEFVREDLNGGSAPGGVRLPRRGRRGLGDWAWGYWYSHREYRDDRLAVCATTLDAGTERVIEYVLRCERPGDFHVLPPRAMDMYDTDVGGTGAEDRLSIR